MPQPKQNQQGSQLCKRKAPRASNYKGTRAMELSFEGHINELSCTATTIRPTSRSISICSHHMVIIAKEKSKQGHTHKRNNRVSQSELNCACYRKEIFRNSPNIQHSRYKNHSIANKQDIMTQLSEYIYQDRIHWKLALVVASTALQSHCQWVSPYHTQGQPLSV